MPTPEQTTTYPHLGEFFLVSAANASGAAIVWTLIWIWPQPPNPGAAALIGWLLCTCCLIMREASWRSIMPPEQTTLDTLVNYQTWFARGLNDGIAKERARCLRIADHYRDHPMTIVDGEMVLRLLRKAIDDGVDGG